MRQPKRKRMEWHTVLLICEVFAAYAAHTACDGWLFIVDVCLYDKYAAVCLL